MMFLSSVFGVCYALLSSAQSITAVFVARTLTGMCSGIVSSVVPLYVAEVTSAEVRGRLGSAIQVSKFKIKIFGKCNSEMTTY